ncbi:hypothetical protein ACQY0O_003908 [Thecaphora frezii]
MSRLHSPSSTSEPTPHDTAHTTPFQAALASVEPINDFARIPTMPCARSSLLMGIASGAGVVGIHLIAGRGLRPGLNWGVGTFCFISLASWETCRRSRKAELLRMRTVIESYNRGGRKNADNIQLVTSDTEQPPSTSQ